MFQLQGMTFKNPDSLMLPSPISYSIDLVQKTYFLIKVLRTGDLLDWLSGILTIQLNLNWGVITVCPLLLVMTLLIQSKWSLSSSRISVVLFQSSSIPQAPWRLVGSKSCSSYKPPCTIVVCCGNSTFNVLVWKTGVSILFSKWLASSDA